MEKKHFKALIYGLIIACIFAFLFTLSDVNFKWQFFNVWQFLKWAGMLFSISVAVVFVPSFVKNKKVSRSNQDDLDKD